MNTKSQCKFPILHGDFCNPFWFLSSLNFISVSLSRTSPPLWAGSPCGGKFPYCLPVKCIFSGSPHCNFAWHQLTNLGRQICNHWLFDSASWAYIHWFPQDFGFQGEQVWGIWLLSDHNSRPPQVAAERLCLRLHLGLVGHLPRAGAWYICVVYLDVCFHRYNIHTYCFGDWGEYAALPPTPSGFSVDSPFCLLGFQQGPTMTSPQIKQVLDNFPSSRKILRAIHEAGGGIRQRGIKTLMHSCHK